MKQLTVIDQDTLAEFSFYDNLNGVILRDFEGFEYSSVKSSIDEVAGNQSGVYVNSKFGVRRISWAGDLLSDTVFTLRRQMIAPMRQTGTIKLIKFTTYDDLELQCEAEIIKVLNPYNHSIHSFLIEAIMPDWRFYSQTEKTPTVDVNTSEVVENEGDETTDPIFQITGPASSISINNLTTGESFTINNLIAGEVVVVDVKNKTVELDGSAAFNYFSGDFIRLLSGENQIEFVVGSGNTGATELEITYRDAYNGI